MNLAAEMAAGEDGLRAAELRVQRLLTRLFPVTPTSAGWQGWRYTRPAGIDVYQARDSAGAARQLHEAGFVTVTLHDHLAEERLVTCRCRRRELL
jgi:hypothetical protein